MACVLLPVESVQPEMLEDRGEPWRGATAEAILCVTRVDDGSLVMRRPLEGRSWIIGRSAEAHIQLDDEAVSRAHAELKRCPFGRWWIHDLSSTNGTLVNGRRVRSRILSNGDQLVVGAFHLALETVDSGEQPPSRRDSDPGEEDDEARKSDIEACARPARLGAMELLPESARRAGIGAAQIDAAMALGRRLMQIEEAGARRQELCETMVNHFGAHGALVLRLYEGGRLQLLSGPHGGDGAAALPASVSQQVMRSLWEQRSTVVATIPAIAPESADAWRTQPGLIGAPGVLACPIAESPERIDALYVSLASTPSDDKWQALLRLLASAYEQAELVWQMRRQVRSSAFVEHELDTARKLQCRLMPLDARFDDLEVVMGYEPCLWVGGDYVDAVALPDGRVLLVIADVCGKGLQGALVTSSLHTLVRATVDGGEELPMLVGRMNRYLCRHLPEHSFVTLAAVALEPKSGALECVNAGHLPALVARPDAAAVALQCARNPALGILEHARFASQIARLEEDEVLLLYTDGLVDLLDGHRNPLGPERFSDGVARAVSSGREQPLAALDAALRRMIDDHRRARLANDDAAYLIVRRAAPARHRCHP